MSILAYNPIYSSVAFFSSSPSESLASYSKIQSGFPSNNLPPKNGHLEAQKAKFLNNTEKKNHSQHCAKNQHNFYLGEKRSVM